MKITFRGDYALKTLLALALQYQKKLLTIPDLAESLDIPKKFLEQVLLDLKKGGFVDSKRGKEGGYFLAQEPAQITVGAVVRYIEGPLAPIACVDDGYQGCQEIGTCVYRQVWQKTTQAISNVVDNVSLEDLVIRQNKAQEILNYSI